MPPDGAARCAQSLQSQQRFAEHGLDYSAPSQWAKRHLISTSGLIWDRSDGKMTASGPRALFQAALGHRQGWLQRVPHPPEFMDDVAKRSIQRTMR